MSQTLEEKVRGGKAGKGGIRERGEEREGDAKEERQAGKGRIGRNVKAREERIQFRLQQYIRQIHTLVKDFHKIFNEEMENLH